MFSESDARTRPSPRPFLSALAALVVGSLLTAHIACQSPQSRPAPTPSSPTPRSAAAPPAPIRIGAWNIEWLGTPGSRSGPAKGHAQAAEDLADYIATAGVSILGVEEIAETDAAAPPEGSGWVARTNATLRAAFEIVEARGGGSWRHQLYPARTGRNQLCGLAWNAARVTAVGAPVPVTLSDPDAGATVWSRPPYAQMFSAGDGLTDFAVVVVHMKSNYNGDFSQQRAREADELVAALAQTVADPDVLIIGDANCGSHAEPAVTKFEQAGFVDLNAADTPTHIRYGPLDRAFVPRGQPEFAASGFQVLREEYLSARGITEPDFKVRFSDHFMVVTELAVGPDDD